MNKTVNTSGAAPAIGPYSQGVISGNMVFVSGQLPLDPKTGEMVSGGIKEQTQRSLENAKAILEEAGSSLAKVVKTTVLMQDLKQFQEMNEVYASFFAQPFPARAAYQVAALPKGAMVEIEMIASV